MIPRLWGDASLAVCCEKKRARGSPKYTVLSVVLICSCRTMVFVSRGACVLKGILAVEDKIELSQ